ncbi:A disintegrin and metalloproteinase with thrombospondin motifs 12-like [Amphibalanus amphitrite]|uniref:A disintegrin and metalloproteinase with thrombospondin motifs 12-like n=1 Tax=Amphibalanus amphitrite TaxID=1232801 RepID=UPI001C90AD51|nr:A disintegrin and metalloproteinase with thrombospondin motifs 12-like [Amphibalanus amphitrite]
MVTDWTQQCSVECGQGVQSRGVACGGDPGRCDLSQRPSDTRPCKTDRGCAGTWFTGPWSQCSRECGVGGEATRTVLCVRQSAGQFSVTADLSCAGSPRPAAQQPCGAGPERRCPPRWFTAEWAECSVTCGSGQQRRVVACVGADGRLAAGCPDGERPEERRPCQQAECPGAAFTTEPAPTPPSRPESPAAEPPSQPRLTPVLGPEYHTVEGSDTEVQLGSEDGPLGGHGTGLSGGDRSGPWDHQLRAQTANQTETARPAASEPLDGPGLRQKSGGKLPEPAASLQDSWSSGTIERPVKSRVTSPGAEIDSEDNFEYDSQDSSSAPTDSSTGRSTQNRLSQESETNTTTTAPETVTESESDGGGAAPVDRGGEEERGRSGDGSGNGADGEREDSCTDSLSHCSLVRRARLCQTSFYATSCCASCRHQRR